MTKICPNGPSTLFVGLGKMGEPMVRRYARTRQTFAYDSNGDAVARVSARGDALGLTDLRDLPSDTDVVILMLPNSKIVEAVLWEDDVLARLPAGALVIDMGSSQPASTRTLAARAAQHGIDYVDAPVSGGVAKATDGTLAILMGGSDGAVLRATPHVATMGSRLLHVGGPGTGHAAKSLNNWLSASNVAAAAEILSVAVQFGIAPEVMVEVLNASTGRSQATEVKYPNHILTNTYDSGFGFDLMLKDLKIADGLAKSHHTYTPVLSAVLGSVEDARAFYSKDGLDHTEVARFYADKNQLSFSSRNDPGQA